jgi:hypothetical protein
MKKIKINVGFGSVLGRNKNESKNNKRTMA